MDKAYGYVPESVKTNGAAYYDTASKKSGEYYSLASTKGAELYEKTGPHREKFNKFRDEHPILAYWGVASAAILSFVLIGFAAYALCWYVEHNTLPHVCLSFAQCVSFCVSVSVCVVW